MRRACFLLICVAGLTLVGNAVAEDAGIWQFLLGQGRGSSSAAPTQPSYWGAPPQSTMPSLRAAPHLRAAPRFAAAPRFRKKQVVHAKIARPKEIAHADIPQKGPVSIYQDRTLRRGDSVMTAQGLRVFKGASHFPYRASDFVALAEASRFVMGDKKQLRDIQLAYERIDVPATQFAALATGRSVSTGPANAKMVSAAGKQIRYVGP